MGETGGGYIAFAGNDSSDTDRVGWATSEVAAGFNCSWFTSTRNGITFDRGPATATNGTAASLVGDSQISSNKTAIDGDGGVSIVEGSWKKTGAQRGLFRVCLWWRTHRNSYTPCTD